jgi:hypothetical protein
VSEESPLVAVLDACVLVPLFLRDTLLRAAEAGVYDVQLTRDILAEVQQTLVDKEFTTAERAVYLITTIRTAFSRSLVGGYQHRIRDMTNHPSDRHVLAAAVTAGATVIVTNNLRHYPSAALEPHGIEAHLPGEFLLGLAALYPDQMVAIIRQQAADLRSPSMTVDDVLERLWLHAPAFVDAVRERIRQSDAPDT